MLFTSPLALRASTSIATDEGRADNNPNVREYAMRCKTGVAVLLAAVWFAAVVAKSGPPTESREFRAFDGFDGKLALNWKPVRHDPTHISTTKRAGKLTIRSQQGSIHGTGNSVLAKNLLLIDNPAPGDADFVVTARIEAFRPTVVYQQAGVICYDDDDNYLKWGCERSWRPGVGTHFCLVAETGGRPAHGPTDGTPGEKHFWLRLTKHGNRYRYSSSSDGQKFVVYGQQTWGNGAPKRIGILAKNGGDERDREIDAHFDFFEVRCLTPDEKQDPSYADMQKLLGTWQVVSCRLSGKPLEKAPLSEFVFSKQKVTIREAAQAIREGAQAIQTDYTLDAAKKPKQLLLSSLLGITSRAVRAVYSLEADTLVICLDPRPGAPAPGELETKQGDGRLLATLKRVTPTRTDRPPE